MLASPKKMPVVLIGFLMILGVAFWSIGRSWHANQSESLPSDESLTPTALDMTALKFLSSKEVLARLERQETILLIDIRTKEIYDLEHIVDAVSMPLATLATFSPNPGQLVIVISGPDIPNEALKGVHTLFTERKFSFAFLEGSLADWQLAGGTTISSGDPDSSLDFSKVIFINSDQVLPLAATLSSPLFLDVRSSAAFATSHLPGATHLPLGELERRREEIPRQKSLFVYGADDYESYQAGVRLFDLGFYGVRVIRGGFDTWTEQKLPMEAGAPPTPVPTRP